MRHTLRNDEGFTLAELLVVISLLGFVLMGTYSALQVAFKAGDIQRRDAFVATSIAEPLQSMDVVLSQNISVDAIGSGPYSLSCVTDADADNELERHIYMVSTEGTLVEDVYDIDADKVNTVLRRRSVWQQVGTDPVTRNANQLLAIPAFKYQSIDESGVPTPADPADANMVEVRLCVRYQGSDYQDSRQIMFRNR